MSRIENLYRYLQNSATAFPERCAVVDSSGTALTYRELDRLSDRIATFLVDAGVQIGARVGVIAPKSSAVVAVLFGIMKAGCAYVPADYTAPAARNRIAVSDCGVKVAFLHPGCAAILDEWPKSALPEVVWLETESTRAPEGRGIRWDVAAGHDSLPAPRDIGPSDLA